MEEMTSAAERIERLTGASLGKTVTIADKEYSTTKLHDPRREEPEPATLELHTLKSLVDYIKSTHDAGYFEGRERFVHVESPTSVRLVTNLFGDFNQRVGVARSKYVPPIGFNLNSWYDPESFNIALQSHFVDDAHRVSVLKIAGNLTDSAVASHDDDGMSQEVTVRAGVKPRENVKVPNPVELAPFRTFTEVKQPASPFIFRARRGGDGVPPQLALFEADGGAWRLDAVRRVHAWLEERLENAVLVIS